jgi:predicted DNA-binding transcriptional regulator AlpA
VDVKRLLQKKLIAEVKYLKQNKMLSVSQIVKITGRSRNTIYKVLKENLGYVSNRLVRANQSFSGDVYEAGDGACDFIRTVEEEI